MHFAGTATVTAQSTASISAAWSDLTASWPGNATNEDRTITWAGGGSRTVSVTYGGSNTLSYRIDSGSWVTYSAGFSFTSGQTLAWRTTAEVTESTTVTVRVNGVPLDTFAINTVGSP